MTTLFDGTYRRGRAAEEASREGWLRALLDVEAALALANSVAGRIPADAAQRVVDVCQPERLSVASLTLAAADHATIVVPLVAALREAVGERDAHHVHRGATSQDVIDSAAMLVARRALVAIEADLAAAAVAARALAVTHAATPIIGRTLLQQALPTTFGLRAAGWMTALDHARRRLREVRERELYVQLGGPVGTGDPRVAAALAAQLGLAAPVLPWHTDRLPVAALAGALGATAGALAKVARDVTLLAQDEVAEVREGGPGRGRSSAMPHKRNPVSAVSVLACARRTPGLVATLLASMEQEHERAAGAWQAEWGTLTDLLTLTGSAAAWGRDLLERLEIDPARMARNLAARQGDEMVDTAAAERLITRAVAAHDGRLADAPAAKPVDAPDVSAEGVARERDSTARGHSGEGFAS